MAEPSAGRVEAAWRALWSEGGRYNLPNAAARGLTTGRVRLAPLRVLRIPDVGPLSLFNREPWNGVALWLTRNRLTLAEPLRQGTFEYDPSSGRLRVTLGFPCLIYSAHYLLRSGLQPPSAMRVAAATLGVEQTDDGNLALAGQYQDNLLASDNGITLVGTYWDNNEAYNFVFANSVVLQNQWTQTETPPSSGQNTLFFSNQTSSAAQFGLQNPPPVQGAVSSNGYSHYAAHAATMQNFVWQTCLTYAKHEPDSSSQYAQAGSASSQFLAATQNFAAQPMSVPSVMSTVAGSDRTSLLSASPGRAPWQDLVDARAAEFAPLIEAEVAATKGYRRPLHHSRRQTPGRGTVREELCLERVVLEGTLTDDGPRGCPRVTLDVVSGGDLAVGLRLSPFEGPLFEDATRALGEANFLRDALGQRLGGAVAGPRLASFVSTLMNLALEGVLGPVA